MRNTRGGRERFDVSLESRQVAMLFVLSLVILTLVFALGIIVGRGMTHPSGMQADVREAEVASRPQVLPEEIPEEGPDTPKPAPPAEPAAPTLRFFEDGQESPAREAPVRTRTPSAQETQAAEKPAEPKPTPQTATPTTPQPSPTQPAAESGAKPYTIQVSAFQDQAQADRMVQRLKSKNYDAYVVKATIPGRGVWYRVRIGQYAQREEAERVAAVLKSREGIATYVTLRQ